MKFDYDRRMGRQIKALREARGLSQEQLAPDFKRTDAT